MTFLNWGGGDASTTVISPKLFDDFIAPYDTELIQMVHEAGQRIAYHTCGGMMPILENIAEMKPDAKPLREKEQSNPACSGKSVEQLQTAA